MSTLSTQPYKGTRDYYPEDKKVQNYIFSVWRRVVERHGYLEYSTPLLEPIEIYTAKSGQELANEQTYTFADRGDRTVAIRPEMTPSVSRMVAARRQELGYPARFYSIANFMRYERPQRGREREFWQLNADVFGIENVYADLEMIELAHEIMTEFGAKEDMYTIRINNRELIEHMMNTYLGLDAVGSQMMIKLFDRKEKIADAEFIYQAREIFGEVDAEEGLSKIAKITSCSKVSELPAGMHALKATKDLVELFDLLNKAGIDNARFDISLMRGLEYYTGTVFEVFDLHPDNNRAMFGGGRYDGLVGLFGVEPIATVGFAPGLTTTELFLRSHNLLPNIASKIHLTVVVVDNNVSQALDIARRLREEGLNVEVDTTGRKLQKQIKSVLKKKIPYVLFVGEEEIRTQVYNLKNTLTESEKKLSLNEVVDCVNNEK